MPVDLSGSRTVTLYLFDQDDAYWAKFGLPKWLEAGLILEMAKPGKERKVWAGFLKGVVQNFERLRAETE